MKNQTYWKTDTNNRKSVAKTNIYKNDELILRSETQRFHDINHFLVFELLTKFQQIAPKRFQEFTLQTSINLKNCGDFNLTGEVILEIIDRFFGTNRVLELSIEKEFLENNNLNWKPCKYLVIQIGNLLEARDENYNIRQTWTIFNNFSLSSQKTEFRQEFEAKFPQNFELYFGKDNLTSDLYSLYYLSQNQFYSQFEKYLENLHNKSSEYQISLELQLFLKYYTKLGKNIDQNLEQNIWAMEVAKTVFLEDLEQKCIQFDQNYYFSLGSTDKITFLENFWVKRKAVIHIFAKREDYLLIEKIENGQIPGS